MRFGKALIMKNYEMICDGRKVHIPFINNCLNRLKKDCNLLSLSDVKDISRGIGG